MAESGLSAEGYLEQVVCGTLPADPSRVRAALGLIRFQSVQKRAPLPAPPPKELQKRAEVAAEKSIATAFEKRAAEIRRKHAARQLKED